MALLRGVLPALQRSAWVGAQQRARTASRVASPVPRADVCFAADEQFHNLCMTAFSRRVKGGGPVAARKRETAKLDK
jgi:hypothetical protein